MQDESVAHGPIHGWGLAERLLPGPLRFGQLRLQSRELLFGRYNFLIEILEFCFLFRSRRFDEGFFVPEVIDQAFFWNVVKIGEKLIELLLLDRVVLVVVAAGAAHRQSEPHR